MFLFFHFLIGILGDFFFISMSNNIKYILPKEPPRNLHIVSINMSQKKHPYLDLSYVSCCSVILSSLLQKSAGFKFKTYKTNLIDA